MGPNGNIGLSDHLLQRVGDVLEDHVGGARVVQWCSSPRGESGVAFTAEPGAKGAKSATGTSTWDHQATRSPSSNATFCSSAEIARQAIEGRVAMVRHAGERGLPATRAAALRTPDWRELSRSLAGTQGGTTQPDLPRFLPYPHRRHGRGLLRDRSSVPRGPANDQRAAGSNCRTNHRPRRTAWRKSRARRQYPDDLTAPRANPPRRSGSRAGRLDAPAARGRNVRQLVERARASGQGARGGDRRAFVAHSAAERAGARQESKSSRTVSQSRAAMGGHAGEVADRSQTGPDLSEDVAPYEKQAGAAGGRSAGKRAPPRRSATATKVSAGRRRRSGPLLARDALASCIGLSPPRKRCLSA